MASARRRLKAAVFSRSFAIWPHPWSGGNDVAACRKRRESAQIAPVPKSSSSFLIGKRRGGGSPDFGAAARKSVDAMPARLAGL
jgi:hypothetical protein